MNERYRVTDRAQDRDRTKAARLREIDRRGFVRRLGPILDVYATAMHPPTDQLPGRHSIMERHATYPRFRAWVAESRRSMRPSAPIQGFAYGFRGEAGQWWHDVVRQALIQSGGRDHAATWLEDTFEVAELHVHPAYQGQGLGRRLLNALCSDRPERTVVLSTLDLKPDTPARRLYRSVGMIDLLSDFEFPGGGPLYAVMGATLPLIRT